MQNESMVASTPADIAQTSLERAECMALDIFADLCDWYERLLAENLAATGQKRKDINQDVDQVFDSICVDTHKMFENLRTSVAALLKEPESVADSGGVAALPKAPATLLSCEDAIETPSENEVQVLLALHQRKAEMERNCEHWQREIQALEQYVKTYALSEEQKALLASVGAIQANLEQQSPLIQQKELALRHSQQTLLQLSEQGPALDAKPQDKKAHLEELQEVLEAVRAC